MGMPAEAIRRAAVRMALLWLLQSHSKSHLLNKLKGRWSSELPAADAEAGVRLAFVLLAQLHLGCFGRGNASITLVCPRATDVELVLAALSRILHMSTTDKAWSRINERVRSRAESQLQYPVQAEEIEALCGTSLHG